MATAKIKNSKPASKSGTAGKKSSGNGTAKQQSQNSNGNALAEGSMLEEFVLDSLKDIYWAEKHLLKALPKMQKAATTDELKQAFGEHLTVTQGHVSRLENVFEIMGKKAQGKKCEAMEGLTKEADSIIEETEKGTMTRDVALICAAQKVEHYEIATYGSLVQLATTLGLTDAADLFQQTLDEEKEADHSLTDIAETKINWEAKEEDADEEEEG